MARESGPKQERIPIPYFEGVNSTVQQVIARKSEMAHMENARSPVIGVLEKRQGQSVIGTTLSGDTFAATGNYGLTFFDDGGTASQGLIKVASQDGSSANIFYLNQDDVWTQLDNEVASGLSLSTCDFVDIEGNLIIVNGVDQNMMIIGEVGTGTEMVDATMPGSLFNSPVANKVAFYKSRIYLADYQDASGTELKTTVLRSSYPMGLVSLINGDISAVDSSNNWILPVMDTKYLYTDQGMNIYEIYRGNTRVATVTISGLTETSMTAPNAHVIFDNGFTSFLSADEVWIGGTFSTDKQYRWISNSSSIGRDVKQYDTFKLAGGGEDAITILEPIGNILLMANKSNMMTWNDFTLENFDIGVGCCSTNGYVKLKGALYFIHYSGIYSTSGSVPQLLSRKVDRYIRGATKAGLEAAAAGFKGLSVFFTIGDVTLYNNDGSLWKTLPNVCLEFNIADQNWFVHTNVNATQFQTYIQSTGGERLTMNSFSAGKDQTLGDELLTNGSFTGSADGWSVGQGWSYASNGMDYTK